MLDNKNGQSFIALVFLIGGIVAVIGVTLALFTSTFVDSGFGYQSSVQADAAANSGAEDALLQLDRNINFPTGSYSFPVGSTTASVSITQNAPATNFINVTSTATVSNHTRTIDVILSKNTTTSQVTIVTWQETQ